MEGVRTSETSVSFYQTTLRNIPGGFRHLYFAFIQKHVIMVLDLIATRKY
jgi:hypothetical protein